MMKYNVCQLIKVVDMNNEIIQEVLFQHGEYDRPGFTIGCSVITPALGLKEFEVVYDRRYNETVRSKIIDIEFDLVANPVVTRAYLEPVTLIIGQHDIGQF
jgi:hypothetical protein